MVPVTHPSSSNSDDPDDEENKPFKCNVCCKGFKLKGGLQQHERTHSTDRPYVCPDCGKLFRQPTHLQQHMRIHTGEKPYDCTFCDKSFRQRTILNQHLRIHTGEKPYVCMECGKQFRQKAILDQHYRTHLGDKPYACPHPSCRKHFREMASLISHMKCHKDVPDPKIVLQQAKRLIKEEKLDEYGNHEGNGIGGSGGPSIEVLTIPHPPGLSNHDGPPERDPGGGSRYQNNGEQHGGTHNAPRSYASSSSTSNANQRSPHSMHAASQGSSGANDAQSLPHSQSIPSGMMPTPPQMAMANLIPYPHSIFPATSYMMTSPPDPRQYHQLPTSASQTTTGGNQSSTSLQSRPNQ